MIITYQGLESFRISHGDLVLAINPVSKDSKHKSKSFGADVTLITTNHPDMNGADQTSRGDKKSFIINGPGEYEVKDVFVKGFLSETEYQGTKLNTVYLATFEGMNLCFLGALSNPELSSETLETLENVDILFTPVEGDPEGKQASNGAGGVLNAEQAYKLAVSLEPAIIIPMHYSETTLKQFLKEGGGERNGTLDKLVIKKKDLEGRKGDIIVLKQE